MRSVVPLWAAKISYIVTSALLSIVGMLWLFVREGAPLWLCRAGGVALVLFGAAKLFGYFSKDLFRLAYQHDLAVGVLMLILGAVLSFCPLSATLGLACVFGVSVLAEGLFRLQTALDARQFGLKSWWLILTLAIFCCVFGLLLMLCPDFAHRLMGVLFGLALLTDGVANLGTVLTSVKIIPGQRSEQDCF